MNNKRNNRYKSRGSILVITALAAIVWIFIAQSLFIVGAGGFGMIKSSRVALQAQQYAEIEVDRLKNVAYENLDSDGAHSRQAIANIQESGWEDEVSIGSEHAISGSDDAKQRIATINVYKSGDTLPRFTLEVPLSSQDSKSKWGPPDRSKARFLSLQELEKFIAPDNGYLYCWVNAYGKEFSGIYVNGLLAYSHEPANSDDNQGHGSLIPFVKGDRVTGFRFGGSDVFYPPFTNYYIYWMPCKR